MKSELRITSERKYFSFPVSGFTDPPAVPKNHEHQPVSTQTDILFGQIPGRVIHIGIRFFDGYRDSGVGIYENPAPSYTADIYMYCVPFEFGCMELYAYNNKVQKNRDFLQKVMDKPFLTLYTIDDKSYSCNTQRSEHENSLCTQSNSAERCFCS